ncbi:MAG TPA: DUF4279 domain-containing protein [Candidatus Competibacter sp.]|nr:DUF4279 domain-containing protein [Candidatus Competibacter sp.]
MNIHVVAWREALHNRANQADSGRKCLWLSYPSRFIHRPVRLGCKFFSIFSNGYALKPGRIFGQMLKMKKHRQRSITQISTKPYNYTSFWIALPKDVDDPEPLSQKLGLTPTATRKSPIDALPPAAWILRIDGLPFPNDCQEHVDWLLAKLKGKEDVIRGLREKGYWVGVMCHWYIECGGKPELRLDTVKQLEDLEICLDFELEQWE